MNINDPTISRQLAILIQPIVAEDRRKFIRDAENAKDMDEVLRSLPKYRTAM
jgi:hypothetical protein